MKKYLILTLVALLGIGATACNTVNITGPVTTTETTTAPDNQVQTTIPETTTEPPILPEGNVVQTVKTNNGHTIAATDDGLMYVDGILIANKTFALPESYYPGGLTQETSEAFAKLQVGAAADGLEIFLLSGFRSYETQRGLYNRYCEQDGQDAADRYSARPGHSEHQTGLALDVNSVSASFADTAEGRWIEAHCAEYGFILRYPKGKEAQTGYMYEPWHIRYVGTELARKITDSGLCFEEYFGITSCYAQ